MAEDNSAVLAAIAAQGRTVDLVAADIHQIRERQVVLSDQIAAYHGDTVGVKECKECREDHAELRKSDEQRWIDKRYLLGALAVLVPVIGVMTWLVGLVLR